MVSGECEVESQPDLFMYMQGHRDHDPVTSVMAAANVTRRARSQKWTLLICYTQAGETGLTAEEAGIQSGLAGRRASYWRRVSDLKALGLIEPTGSYRLSTMNERQMVCRITAAGRAVLEGAQG